MKKLNISVGSFGIAIAVLLWGSAFPGVRYAVQKFHPLNLVALRFLISSLGLLIFALFSKKIRLPLQKDIPRMAALLFDGPQQIRLKHPVKLSYICIMLKRD